MVGHERCPARPPAEQEGLGVRHQRRTIPSAGTHIAKAKRRGGCQGEAVQLCASGQCEESEEPTDDGCGGLVGGKQGFRFCDFVTLSDTIILIVVAHIMAYVYSFEYLLAHQ